MKMPFQKLAEEGQLVPRYYGIAWVDYQRDALVCFPVPLNKIAGMVREFVFWLKRPYQAKFSKMLQEAYCAGLERERKLRGENKV